MATFLIAHGAWSAGWAWKKMRPLMAQAGHDLWTPTYTGLGERRHLSAADIDLQTHVDDILGVLETEDLRNVILVGHSYGGMVATGVAALVPERIRKLVYLDAFVPRDGESLAALTGGEAAMRQRASSEWLIPPREMPPDTEPADVAWARPRRVAQPIWTFLNPVSLPDGEPAMPRAYIYCTRPDAGDGFRRFADRAKAERWEIFDIDASHNPHITAPHALMAILETIAKG